MEKEEAIAFALEEIEEIAHFGSIVIADRVYNPGSLEEIDELMKQEDVQALIDVCHEVLYEMAAEIVALIRNGLEARRQQKIEEDGETRH